MVVVVVVLSCIEGGSGVVGVGVGVVVSCAAVRAHGVA